MSQQMPERIPGGGMDLSHLASRPAEGQSGAGQPAGGGAGGTVVDVPSLVMEVTDQTFEQVAQLSTVVPVVLDLWAEWCEPCKTLGPILEQVTRDYGGRLVLGKIDVEANPRLAQAFQAQSIPMVLALVGGRPVPLFQGAIPESQVREFFDQLLQLGAQQGLTGRVNAADADGEDGADAPAEPEVPEAHLPAVEAAERGDFETAIREYEAVLAKAPADAEARAALVQMRLLHRLSDASAEEIRSAAAERPADTAAQMRVADLDISGGHVEDAFLRLLELFERATDAVDRQAVRERLLELFEVVGVADPRVIAARGRLATLLY